MKLEFNQIKENELQSMIKKAVKEELEGFNLSKINSVDQAKTKDVSNIEKNAYESREVQELKREMIDEKKYGFQKSFVNLVKSDKIHQTDSIQESKIYNTIPDVDEIKEKLFLLEKQIYKNNEEIKESKRQIEKLKLEKIEFIVDTNLYKTNIIEEKTVQDEPQLEIEQSNSSIHKINHQKNLCFSQDVISNLMIKYNQELSELKRTDSLLSLNLEKYTLNN